MYVSRLLLEDFRSFSDAEILLCPYITVFVGENNGGKSNAIDALRLLSTPLAGRRELYCESTDVRIGSSHSRFELEMHLAGLTGAQCGRLISAAADSSLETAVFGLLYDESKGSNPPRPSFWAGYWRGEPEAGSRQMIRHIYLPPLRDARRALASGSASRMYTLLQYFLGDQRPEDLAKQLSRKTNADILGRVDEAVDVGLEALTGGVRRQRAAVGFADDEKLYHIARDLRFKLADHGIAPEDLQYSGHGYANLLFMATIAVELQQVDTADLTLFLLEEPEAHLHPQLQAAVLSFLNSQSRRSRSGGNDKKGPAGEVQVVVTTHSPNLASWVPGESVVVFKSTMSVSTSFSARDAGPRLDDAAAMENVTRSSEARSPSGGTLGRRMVSKCVALQQLQLSPEIRRKIDRYIDVTKSAMLFGGRVLLVEGMSDALVIRAVAEYHVLKDNPAALRVFQSAVIAPIDGVDFAPYVQFLLSHVNNVSIAERVVVATDGDTGDMDGEGETPGHRRKRVLEELGDQLEAASRLSVVANDSSLEYEIILAGNGELARTAYLQLHPRSSEKWDSAVSAIDARRAVRELFSGTRKGDFGHILADLVRTSENFEPPEYVTQVIQDLVG